MTFKRCPMCGKLWPDRDSFLDDPTLELNGYAADFDMLEEGLFYFTHEVPSCRSTLVLLAGLFFDLYSGERFGKGRRDGDDCSGFCLEQKNLERCAAFCEFAFVREVIQIILRRQKNPALDSGLHQAGDGVYNITSSAKIRNDDGNA